LRAKACEDKLEGLVTTGRIVFELASAELDSASFATLDKLAEAAKTCPDMRIEVSGHASSEGSVEINQQLSVRRAQSVVAYLGQGLAWNRRGCSRSATVQPDPSHPTTQTRTWPRTGASNSRFGPSSAGQELQD
jgi:hypothetical protein